MGVILEAYQIWLEDTAMHEKQLHQMRVAILVAENFEQAEMTDPRAVLDEAGAQTTLISLIAGKVQAMKHDKKADEFRVDKTLGQVELKDFDALLLPGGALNADLLRAEPQAQELVRAFENAGKPIAMICHAPWLLVSAGLVRGRKLTSYHTIKDDLINAGAKWVDEKVVVDKNWVSSRQPSDIPDFNREMIALFARSAVGAGERVRSSRV
jgi:protease I